MGRGRRASRADDRAAPRTRALCVAATALACAVASIAANPACATLAGADTSRIRIETGPGMDLTNETYYEETFVDTTFLGRRRIATPESRVAGVVVSSIEGTRAQRSTSYRIDDELSLGDRLQRNALTAAWRQDVAPDLRLMLDPALEWRHDRTFDRDQQEWHAALRTRMRRTLADDATSIEGGIAGDVIRTRGPGSEFLLDRNSVTGAMAIDHLPLLGEEWRLGYALADRVFPDSSERDHVEHAWDAQWRHAFMGGSTLAIEALAQRRLPQHLALTSRDHFWTETASLDGDGRLGERWAVRVRLEGEAMQYDLEDSTVFFDYRIVRARLGLQLEREARWSLTVGPIGEVLMAPLAPGEAYREIGGEAQFELLGVGSWWNVTPAAGYRAYDSEGQAGLPGALHSSFTWVSLDAFIDQALPARARLRALTSLRYESHTDPSQNAASVYLSLQLRGIVR
jgi:hypothetical protein